MAGKDAEDVENAEDVEDAEEGKYAVACKGAEQSDLFTDAEEVEDEEEDAKEMLHVNAAFFCGFLTTSFGDSSFVVLTTSFVEHVLVFGGSLSRRFASNS